MERIEAWVRDQNEAREAAEEQVRLARIETERAQMRRLTWEGRRSGKAEKREKKPQKKGIYERFKRLLVKIFQPDTTVQATITIYVSKTIFQPARFSSIVRCASTISSKGNVLPTLTLNVPPQSAELPSPVEYPRNLPHHLVIRYILPLATLENHEISSANDLEDFISTIWPDFPNLIYFTVVENGMIAATIFQQSVSTSLPRYAKHHGSSQSPQPQDLYLSTASHQ